MSNIIKKISARAKQIRKAHPSMKWQSCIKQASKELKGGKTTAKKKSAKKKSAKKVSYRQTGSTTRKADRKRSAKVPGKRVVKHAGTKSTVYYERRRNRSDKPGSLSGVSVSSLKKAVADRLKEQLGKTFVAKSFAKTKRASKKLQKKITSIKTEIRKLK